MWYHSYLDALSENEEGEEESRLYHSVYVRQKEAFRIILILEKLLAKGPGDTVL